VNPAIVITPRDNVATALEPLEPGRVLDLGGERMTVAEPIPRGHKLALRPIAAGEAVLKYGSPIGTATADIAAGSHVHIHNVASARGRGDLYAERSAEEPRIAEPPDTSPVTGAHPSPEGGYAGSGIRDQGSGIRESEVRFGIDDSGLTIRDSAIQRFNDSTISDAGLVIQD
jgi:hypothetical protein